MKKFILFLFTLLLAVSVNAQLLRHNSLGGTKIAPTLAYSQGTNYNKTTPLNVSIPTPTAGNLMVLTVGTNQARTFTYPAGWNQVIFSGGPSGSLEYAWKFAAAGEPTTINISWGGGGTTVGQVYYLELNGVGQVGVVQAYGGGASTNTSSSTTHQYGSHNIPVGVFAIEVARFAIGTSPTGVNSGYTLISTGGVHSVAYNRYNVPTAGVNMTWTVTPASTGVLGIMGFYGVSR